MIELRAKRWPFVESPGEFTQRLAGAMGYSVSATEASPALAAVRNVLIENPPALSPDYFAALPAECGTMEGALTAMLKEALDKLGDARAEIAALDAHTVDGGTFDMVRDALEACEAAYDATPDQQSEANQRAREVLAKLKI